MARWAKGAGLKMAQKSIGIIELKYCETKQAEMRQFSLEVQWLCCPED